MVSAHLYPDRIEVYAENARIARHVRLMDRDQIRYDWQHYRRGPPTTVENATAVIQYTFNPRRSSFICRI